MVKYNRKIMTLIVFGILVSFCSIALAVDSGSSIDINTAGVEQLTTLAGIGPAIAQRIVDYREANGKFIDVAALKNVRGIGSKILEDIRHRITASQ